MTTKKPGRKKHSPLRTCVVCRDTADKRALVRIVRTSEEGIRVDSTGKRAGRGAYLCQQETCWQEALVSNVLAKALKTTITDADRKHLLANAPPLDKKQGDA